MAAFTLLLLVALISQSSARFFNDITAVVDEHEAAVGSLEEAAQHYFHYEPEQEEAMTPVDIYDVVLSLQTDQCRRYSGILL